MTIKSPAASSAFEARIRFDRSPPTTYYCSFWQDYFFNKDTASRYIKKANGLESLPEGSGLFGIILRSYQKLRPNFLWMKSAVDPYVSIIIKDTGSIVKGYLGTPNEKYLKFLGWKVIDSIYIERSSSGDVFHALNYDEYTEHSQSPAVALTNFEFLKRQGAKWGYRLFSVENGQKRLTPFQRQLQGTHNGPTKIGIHWGLQKYINIPDRVGFYLDFYINKIPNFPTKIQDTSTMPPLNGRLQSYFSTTIQSGWNNDDIFDGLREDANNFFNFIGKSYIVVEIFRRINSGDVFYLVIRSDKNPRIYQVMTGTSNNGGTDNRVILLGEYNPVVQKTSGMPVGLAMLQGREKNLRLLIRNFYGSIIIENNVFEEPWVVSIPIFEPERASTTNAASSRTASRRFHIASIGGSLKVYGGNLSCGVAYSPVNYISSNSLTLNDVNIFGSNRNNFRTYLASAGGNQMPIRETTDGLFYPSSARKIIKKINGRIDFVKLIGSYGSSSPPVPSTRRDTLVAGNGREIPQNRSEIIVEDTQSNVALGAGSSTSSHTKLHTEIRLNAGHVKVIHAQSGGSQNIEWIMENTLTPVLQYVSQRAPKVDRFPSRNSLDIKDIVTDFEITKQADEFYVIKTSGSMNVNIHSPTVSEAARNKIIQSIGKNRYLDITLANYCANLNAPDYANGQKLFTGIATNPVIQEQAGKRMVKFELKDFWTILESKIMYNSPFFDGAIDSDVVKYLLEYSGIRDNLIAGGSRDAMPISFIFAEPLAKFNDASFVSDAIKTLAKRYSKYAFFDVNGKFRYDPIPATIIPGHNQVRFAPSFRFYSSHYKAPPQMNINIRPLAPQQVATASGAATGSLNSDAQIAYEIKTTQWNMNDIVNRLLLLSIDARNRGQIVVSDTNYDSLINPDSVGYLGYEKTGTQSEAAAGSMYRVKEMARQYSRMYRPPYTISWKTRGGNTDVFIFDLVGVDDRMVIVNKISHKVDASKNVWETEWEGEWVWHPLSSFNPQSDYSTS